MRRRIFLGSLVLFSTACAAGSPPPTAVPTTPPSPVAPTPVVASTATSQITVSAASSLTDAFKEIGSGVEAKYPDTRVTLNFGASSTLRAQLEQGAKADVFASADTSQMDKAKQSGVIGSDPKIFATNRLVIIVPKDNPKSISSLKDLGKAGIKFVAAQDEVPIGVYTKQILTKAAQDATYGSDFPTRVAANVVSREADDRQIVAKVSLGEADVGIVYATDVTPTAAPKLGVIPIPDALNVVATYPIAVTKGGANPSGGARFVDFVLAAEGQKILAKWGFGPHPNPSP
jgi:molybdate transport system substrate-binding protein